MVQNWIGLFIVVVTGWISPAVWGGPLSNSVALFYSPNPPINELKAFDVVVVDPDSGITPALYGSGPSQLYAYMSVGEVSPNRGYARQIRSSWVIGDNPAWKTRIVDVSNPAWQAYFLDKIVEPLWQAGYRGFFLDTLDSYQLAAKREQLARMEAGLVTIIRALHQRHPKARLILNRGFEIFDRVKSLTYAVAAESLYQNFNPTTGKYGEVTAKDRDWLIMKLNQVKSAGIPVVAIDYVPPVQRDRARITAEKIKALGFIPWVTDKDLSSLGVGSVEVMPRTILGLYDGSEAEGEPSTTRLQRFAVMPLNHLGYQVKLHDLRDPLPEGVVKGRYAGIVIWPYTTIQEDNLERFKKWVFRQMSDGVRVVFLDRFGFTPNESELRVLALESNTSVRTKLPIKTVHKETLVGFEQPPLPNGGDFLPIRLKEGASMLRLADAGGAIGDAAAVTSWGGYILSPFAVFFGLANQTTWVVDPFRFFKAALDLPDMPVPDTTTENGVRLLLAHVDGDGFESRVEWPGGRVAASEIRTHILERYRLPTSVSLITSLLAPNGLHPEDAPQLTRIARDIFALENVEGASHSFSHPLRWKPHQTDEGVQISPEIKLPGYQFNVHEEIVGSLNIINKQLMPPGKMARLFFWSGNCMPSEETVKMASDAGILAMNGGHTLMTDSNKSVSSVAPLGMTRGETFQVFSPNQSESVYTKLWTGPFYGYRRVLETFRLTDLPRRLLPVNIYYHFQSATKEASLEALKNVHHWALSQRLFAIYASEYVEKVMDFNRTVIARDGSGWLVRNGGNLRELRVPISFGYPELRGSSNISGFNEHGESRYIHLSPGGEAWVQLQKKAPTNPYLISAGGFVKSFERTSNGAKLTVKSYTPFTVRIGNASGCRIENNTVSTRNGLQNEFTTDLPEGSHVLAIDCR